VTDRDDNGRFIKGTVPNPKGRPPKEREERFHQVLLTSVSFEDWKRICLKARDQALKGDAVARKWLSDYLIGPPVQRQEHTGAGGGAIVIDIAHDDPD
jgi:hypothetical protein